MVPGNLDVLKQACGHLVGAAAFLHVHKAIRGLDSCYERSKRLRPGYGVSNQFSDRGATRSDSAVLRVTVSRFRSGGERTDRKSGNDARRVSQRAPPFWPTRHCKRVDQQRRRRNGQRRTSLRCPSLPIRPSLRGNGDPRMRISAILTARAISSKDARGSIVHIYSLGRLRIEVEDGGEL